MTPPPRPTVSILFAVVCLLSSALCFPSSGLAQTRAAGPWWPNALWGATDQAGASNWITPEKIKQAAALVKTGRLYELGHRYERGMPPIGNRSFNLFIPSFPTHGPFRSGGKEVYYNDELVTGEIGQVGTQFDGPGHVGQAVTMANGEKHVVFYNGYTDDELRNPYGLLKLGVENVKPIFTRGILLDIAGLRGEQLVKDGYAVTVADLQAALAKQGMTEQDLRPGDALLFNFGWWRLWPDARATTGNRPYLSDEAVAWVIARQPCMVGSDCTLDGPNATVHTDLVMKNGIFNLELMTFDQLAADQAYEFLFVFTPVPLKGATGSPGRPIAIR